MYWPRLEQATVQNESGLEGFLRLYDTFSANDPNEGTFFVTSADPTEGFRQEYPAIWRLLEDRSAAPAYQTSLTQVRKPEEADDLVSWRTYGREGAGCALVFPVERFLGLDNLFRVRYGECAAGGVLSQGAGGAGRVQQRSP